VVTSRAAQLDEMLTATVASLEALGLLPKVVA
jgi:hypothetical protein